ncbi:hypothetical protein Tco_0024599 [Tanacetum coccineum]
MELSLRPIDVCVYGGYLETMVDEFTVKFGVYVSIDLVSTETSKSQLVDKTQEQNAVTFDPIRSVEYGHKRSEYDKKQRLLGQNATILGQNAMILGQNTTIVGQNATIGGQSATSIGQNATSHGQNAINKLIGQSFS